MPRTDVVFYRDDDGSVPVLEWLDGLTLKARLKCLVRLERLRELGHELRRPEADLLRDGIYELRISLNHVQYRVLYAFHTETQAVREAEAKAIKKGSTKKGRTEEPTAHRTIAVVAHGITKEAEVPDEEIDRARARMRKFAADPRRHTHVEG
jgi:phage-related protein